MPLFAIPPNNTGSCPGQWPGGATERKGRRSNCGLRLPSRLDLAIGLAIVTTHNVWRGGLLPLVVTIVGWLLLIRGIVLQAIQPELAQTALNALHFEPLYYAYLAVPLALGAYLFIAGWMSKSRT